MAKKKQRSDYLNNVYLQYSKPLLEYSLVKTSDGQRFSLQPEVENTYPFSGAG